MQKCGKHKYRIGYRLSAIMRIAILAIELLAKSHIGASLL